MVRIFSYKNLNETIWLTSFFLAFILGNAALNLFIFFSTFYVLFNYKKITFPTNISIYLIFLFLLYIFFLGFFYDDVNLKNFSQIRFFFLVYFFYFLRKNNSQFDMILVLIANIFLIVISLDIIIQKNFLFDLFGFELIKDVPTGPFENEVAGSFLSKIFFCSCAYIFFKNGKLNFNRLFVILLAFIAIILTTERMAFFHASVVLLSLVFFELYLFANYKKKILFFMISILIFSNLIIFSEKFRVDFIGKTINQLGFYNLSYKIIENTNIVKNFNPSIDYKKDYISKKYVSASTYSYVKWGFENKQNANPHKKLFNSGLRIFKENLYIGTGVKTFFNECEKLRNSNLKDISFQCSTHPHNIHIQILSEAGLMAYILFILIIISTLYSSFKNFFQHKEIYKLSYFLALILLILPLPSGNMFGTWPGAFFWFILGLNIYDREFIKNNT